MISQPLSPLGIQLLLQSHLLLQLNGICTLLFLLVPFLFLDRAKVQECIPLCNHFMLIDGYVPSIACSHTCSRLSVLIVDCLISVCRLRGCIIEYLDRALVILEWWSMIVGCNALLGLHNFGEDLIADVFSALEGVIKAEHVCPVGPQDTSTSGGLRA